jgi:putative transposase
MDGRGRALDNVFVERLWRPVKYEEVYVKDYGTPREAMQGLERFFQSYNRQRPHQALGWVCPTFYTWRFCQGCVARSATRAL